MEGMRDHWKYRFHAYQNYARPYRKERLWGTRIAIPDRITRHIAHMAWTYQTVDHFYDDGFSQFLRELQSKYDFSAVIASYVFFSKSLMVFDEKVLKILDTHDVFAGRNRLFRQNGMAPEWFYTNRSEESVGLDRADRVIAIQHGDLLTFESRTVSNQEITEVGHLYAPQKSAEIGNGGRVHFMGSNGTLNVQALNWFIQNAWPLVRNRLPDATLHVFGNINAAFSDKTHGQEIEFVGTVDDPAEAFDRADVFINPMIFGTGLKIKSIEALAHGVPMVSRPAGVEGLDIDALRGSCIICESPEDFAEATAELVSNKESNLRMRKKALEFHRSYLEKQKSNLIQIFE
jgi:glycosyltransferase involved in cell wall biosynthesis